MAVFLYRFLSDYATICLPSWTHLLDAIFATWGSYLFFYCACWEYMDVVQYFCGVCGLIHAAVAFSMSRYYRKTVPDLDSYVFWHGIWHTAFPFWVTALGFYSTKYLPDAPPRWYPPVLLSFVLPWLLCVAFTWVTRMSRGLALTVQGPSETKKAI